MYSEGTIFYFTPFYFPNGNTCKDKFLIVLKNIDNKTVCISLPTKEDHVPQDIPKNYGCLNNTEYRVNCFFIPKNHTVTDYGWSFKLDTYLYSEQISDYEISSLEELYKINGVDYKIIGNLSEECFQEIILCFTRRDNKNIQRKYLRMLSI